MLVSGRSEAQLLEACGIFGADGYVAELGAMVGWDRGRGRHLLRGAMPEEFDAIPGELVDGHADALRAAGWSSTTRGTSATSSTSCCAGRSTSPR